MAATATSRPPVAVGGPLSVPPAWLPLSFLACAAAGLAAFGVALVSTAATSVVAPMSPTMVATAHLGVLAFLTTAVLGAVHQFGPVVGAKPLRSIRAGAVTVVLFVPGAWLIPLGFATGHIGVVEVGGVIATVAICLAAWNLSAPLLVRNGSTSVVGLRIAVGYLVVTAAFGATYAFDAHHGWFVLLPRRVLAHAHLGLLGWVGLAYVAVAEKLWPMFLLAHRPSARAGRWAVWLLACGPPLVAVGLLLPARPITILGGLLAGAGLAMHLVSLVSVIRHRRRRLELLHGFVLASAACLVVAVGAAVAGGLLPLSGTARSRAITVELLGLLLWLGLAVVGHAHKIVPFISWNRLRARGITTGPDGRPLLFAHLVHQPTARATLTIAAVAAVAGLVGAGSGDPWLVRIAGAGLVATSLLAAANLGTGPYRVSHRRPLPVPDGERQGAVA